MTPSEVPGALLAGLTITQVSHVGGGDIARAARVDTPDGPLFAKWLPTAPPEFFAREAAGLRALRRLAPAGLGVPDVVRAGADGLVLEWISAGRPVATTEEDLGRGLAGLHSARYGGIDEPSYGGIDDARSGYLGTVPLDLTPDPSWPTYYVERRLRPLVAQAVSVGRLDPRAHRALDRLAGRAELLCGPPEPPALLHGDLWSGNRMVGAGGTNWLIDPSAHWGHREVDLAMMRLFGGFGAACFAAYDEAFPLAEGWADRVAWYQLPPLLVHAILFGGGYGASVLSALDRYA